MMFIEKLDIVKKKKLIQLALIVSTAFIASISTNPSAATLKTFTSGKEIVFEDGNQAVRKGLSKYPELAEIVEGRFSIANADFNDDGRVEIILMGADSNFCGSGGCQTYVVEILPSKKIKILSSQYFGGSLAMTNEKVNGYRALASVNGSKIEVANKTMPMHAELLGKQVVYAMQGVSESNANNTTASTPVEPAAIANNSTNKSSPSIAGIALGMSAAEARRIMLAHVRTYDKSLQVKEDGEVGIGSDGKTAAGAKPYIYLYSAGFSGDSYAGLPPNSAPKNIMNDLLYVSLSPPPNSRVMSISRKLRFAYQQDVPSESIYDQLRGKYGPEKGKAYQNPLWFFDNTGKPTNPPAVASIKGRGNCAPELATPNVNYRDTYKRGEARNYFNPACGVVLMIRTETNAASGLTPTVETTLSDNNAISDAIVDSRIYLSGQTSAAESQLKSQANKRAVPNL